MAKWLQLFVDSIAQGLGWSGGELCLVVLDQDVEVWVSKPIRTWQPSSEDEADR